MVTKTKGFNWGPSATSTGASNGMPAGHTVSGSASVSVPSSGGPAPQPDCSLQGVGLTLPNLPQWPPLGIHCHLCWATLACCTALHGLRCPEGWLGVHTSASTTGVCPAPPVQHSSTHCQNPVSLMTQGTPLLCHCLANSCEHWQKMSWRSLFFQQAADQSAARACAWSWVDIVDIPGTCPASGGCLQPALHSAALTGPRRLLLQAPGLGCGLWICLGPAEFAATTRGPALCTRTA